MDIRKLISFVTMVAVFAGGAVYFRSAVSRSEQSYRYQERVTPESALLQQDIPGSRCATAVETVEASKVIVAQLNSFKHDDYVKAMTFQSTTLRNAFPNSAVFRDMIKRNYPEFANYKQVGFGDIQWDACRQMLSVPTTVTGQDGISVSATYFLHKENGRYRVAGVERCGGHCPFEAHRKPIQS